MFVDLKKNLFLFFISDHETLVVSVFHCHGMIGVGFWTSRALQASGPHFNQHCKSDLFGPRFGGYSFQELSSAEPKCRSNHF